jgi:predicted MFS family arabinose efflux permease
VAANAVVLSVALVAMGVGGAAIWIPSPRIAAHALPVGRRGLAAGLVGMGIGIGIVFAGQLADVLRHGRGDDSWRMVYRVEGLIGLAVVVAAIAFLRPVEPITSVPTSAGPGARGGFAGTAALRKVQGWVALTSAYAAFGFMYLLVFAFLVAALRDDAGFSPDRASTMFSVVGLAAVFGGVLIGPLSDRVGRRPTMVGAFVAYGAAALVILVGRQPWVLLGCIGIGCRSRDFRRSSPHTSWTRPMPSRTGLPTAQRRSRSASRRWCRRSSAD